MKLKSTYIIESTLKSMILEAPEQETDNSASSADDSPFTPAEEKFLGKFDAYGTTTLGIIYSLSDIGIREFIGRAGKDLNVTPRILLSLLRNNIIKLVPYSGWGRNDDYTIELQLSLDDVAGLGKEDKEKIETGQSGGTAAGAPPAGDAGTSAVPPAPEVAWVVKYGDILQESLKIMKKLLTKKQSITETKTIKLPIEKTRILKRLPKEYIHHMNRIIKMMDKKTKTTHEKDRLIADVLDILQLSMKLTPKDIRKSFEFHKSQKRLQKYMEKL